MAGLSYKVQLHCITHHYLSESALDKKYQLTCIHHCRQGAVWRMWPALQYLHQVQSRCEIGQTATTDQLTWLLGWRTVEYCWQSQFSVLRLRKAKTYVDAPLPLPITPYISFSLIPLSGQEHEQKLQAQAASFCEDNQVCNFLSHDPLFLNFLSESPNLSLSLTWSPIPQFSVRISKPVTFSQELWVLGTKMTLPHEPHAVDFSSLNLSQSAWILLLF